jgi:hypothetical protein
MKMHGYREHGVHPAVLSGCAWLCTPLELHRNGWKNKGSSLILEFEKVTSPPFVRTDKPNFCCTAQLVEPTLRP